MNSQMRRIDLICKLLGPFFIGIMDGISTETAIFVNLGMNCTSVIVEYITIARVSQLNIQTRSYAHPIRYTIKYRSYSIQRRYPQSQHTMTRIPNSLPKDHGRY